MPGIDGDARLHAASRPTGRTGAGFRPCRPGLWRAFRRWRHDARAVAALEALEARMLKDIGIERSEIESVVRGLGRDASRVDRT